MQCSFQKSGHFPRLGGAGVNQAAGRIWPGDRQLAIAGLYNAGSSTSHNAVGFHGLLRG
jgi:hypothetical protein